MTDVIVRHEPGKLRPAGRVPQLFGAETAADPQLRQRPAAAVVGRQDQLEVECGERRLARVKVHVAVAQFSDEDRSVEGSAVRYLLTSREPPVPDIQRPEDLRRPPVRWRLRHFPCLAPHHTIEAPHRIEQPRSDLADHAVETAALVPERQGRDAVDHLAEGNAAQRGVGEIVRCRCPGLKKELPHETAAERPGRRLPEVIAVRSRGVEVKGAMIGVGELIVLEGVVIPLPGKREVLGPGLPVGFGPFLAARPVDEARDQLDGEQFGHAHPEMLLGVALRTWERIGQRIGPAKRRYGQGCGLDESQVSRLQRHANDGRRIRRRERVRTLGLEGRRDTEPGHCTCDDAGE